LREYGKKAPKFRTFNMMVVIILLVAGHVHAQSAEVKDTVFIVEIADTQEKRRKGLMFRENLCEKCGMLFLFEHPEKYAFWMKNVKIPLDIIYIDKEGTIVDLINAEPCETKDCDV
jgi:uncharacterized membrane protein (UPF0127 family)